jgi:hypothetical protein
MMHVVAFTVSISEPTFSGLPENASTENAGTDDAGTVERHGKCEYGVCDYYNVKFHPLGCRGTF